jgi:hypothetical protein
MDRETTPCHDELSTRPAAQIQRNMLRYSVLRTSKITYSTCTYQYTAYRDSVESHIQFRLIYQLRLYCTEYWTEYSLLYKRSNLDAKRITGSYGALRTRCVRDTQLGRILQLPPLVTLFAFLVGVGYVHTVH